MEQFVLGLFQEHLSKFIVGFHKEQVNANLLNGKGEIKDVSLNCDFLNEVLKKVTPFIQLESVHVSKLSFHVTAWSNLKKAPIVVDVEDVTAVMAEPLGFLDRSERKTARQISQQELNDMITQGLHKLRGAYSLFDRIVDNIHVEMRCLRVSFQPRGKFKTARTGPWTPPTILMQLRHIKYVCVDEYGQEGTPEQMWNHNRHQPGIPASHRTIMIYKKLSLQFTMGLKDAVSGEEVPPPIRDTQLEVHVAFRKRLRDAAVLAVQVDITALKVEVHVPTETVPMMAHATAGLQYCLSKDRAFHDPLVPEAVHGDKGAAGETVEGESVVDTANEEKHLDEDDSDEDDEAGDEMLPVDISESTSDSDEEEETPSPPGPPAKQASSVSVRSQSTYLRRPVIMLPNGLVIHERLSFSLSVHQFTVRGIYSGDDNGYIQLVTKGLVGEAMWPKDSGEKGGYVQASLSYVSLQERYGQRIRSILLGGVQHHVNKLPIGLPGKPRLEKGADSSFPLFEDRSIRRDPLGLRHTFPEQAFGLKTTVSFIEKVSNPEEEDIMVLHEIGMDRFDVLVDADAWCRAHRFAMNECGNGFDDRWHSGDWSEELTTDMLVNPAQPLNLVDHLQTKKELFLDENFMISSDLLNVTARIMNVEIRVPAAIQKDVRSCDIILSVAETMLVVSSALPRTFLTGKIGASIHGEGAENQGRIVFPNDASDLCYSLEASEDPSMRQLGTMTTKYISTARCQLTIRGLSVCVVPVIPFCNANRPQKLVEPTELTMIVCFEGEPPETPESNLVKIVLFVSLQIHRLALNCDFDVVTGALSTAIYHSDVVRETIAVVEKLKTNLLPSTSAAVERENSTKMRKTLKNRRVLVRRQIALSREAGGLSVSACMQLSEFSFAFWRQNVPLTSRFRASLSDDKNVRVVDEPIPLMKLMLFEMKGMEVGAEWFVAQATHRRIVLKGCLSEMKMEICDFEEECEKFMRASVGHSRVEGDSAIADVLREDEHDLIELLMFGVHAHEHRSYAEVAWGHNDILVRAEDNLNAARSMSVACEVGPPGVVYLRVREIESVCLLFIEALLMPTGLSGDRFKPDEYRSSGIVFPGRSVGALFAWCIRTALGSRESDSDAPRAIDEVENDKVSEVDDLVHSSVLKMLPGGVDRVMAHIMVVDVLVFVPDATLKPETPANKTRWLGLVIHQTRLLSGYFSEGRRDVPNVIMNTLASGGITWSNLFASEESGMHLLVRARPSLYSGETKKLKCITTECLISEFEMICSYHPSGFALSMGDTTLSVKNLDDLNHLHCSLLDVKDQATMSAAKLGIVFSALQSKLVAARTEPNENMRETNALTSRDEIREPATETEQSLQGLKGSLNRLRELSESHSLQLKDVLVRQQQRIGFLRYEVFSRERDRIAALALMSSQTTGWLKMGGTHMYGQRLSGVTTMWRYYAVLHKALLILYSSPGQSKPMDIVFLDGALLLPLAGGRRKRDVKRGFSIIESGGVVRFFMAECGPEFECWIRHIDRITKKTRDNQGASFHANEKATGSVDTGVGEGAELRRDSFGLEPSPGSHADGDDSENTPSRVRVRERFSAVTSSTKSKLGSAAAGAKSRLGPAAVGTKNKIGSVVQAARQRSANKAEDEFAVHKQGSTREASGSTVTMSLSGEHSMDVLDEDSEANHPRNVGVRFAAVKAGTKNRFGSALQAAKEKGKAAAEQRRRRIEERGDQTAYQSHKAPPDRFTGDVESQSILASNPTQLRSTTVPLTEEMTSLPSAIDESENDLVAEGDDFLAGAEGNNLTEDADLGAETSFAAEYDEAPSESSPNSAGVRRRQQLKSKLGAAVQSVRRSTAQDVRRKFGGFSVQETDESSHSDLSESVILRGIRVGHGDPAEELDSPDLASEEVQLQRLFGYWVSSVEECPIETHIEVSREADKDVSGTQPPPLSIDVCSQKMNDDSKTETPSTRGHNNDSESDGQDVAAAPGLRACLEDGFKIFVVSDKAEKASEGKAQRNSTEIVRSISDLLALQTALSDCASRALLASGVRASTAENKAGGDESSLFPRQSMNTLDSVRLAGRLLKGLVETGSDEFENPKAFRDYQCELLKEFLNLTLDAPLPRDGIEAISHFLGCPSMITTSFEHHQLPAAQIHSTAMEDDIVTPATEAHIASSQEILACAVACENDLVRLETLDNLSTRTVIERYKKEQDQSRSSDNLSLSPDPVITAPTPFLEPLLPFEITDSLHSALHEALMKIMTERDESHAQLVAAGVLHVHELEQERKRVDRLTEQLDATKALLRAAQLQNVAGNFFADKKLPEQTSSSYSGRMTAMQEEAMKNSEQDMLNLCQQLAREISAKTSASLEIIRLKESRKIERENEHAEKKALQDELKRCKELLVSQERKSREAAEDALAWKQAYENLKGIENGGSSCNS